MEKKGKLLISKGGVHDLHVWSLSKGNIVMSVHLNTGNPTATLSAAKDLAKKWNMLHHTI
jgi:Co/Zn/Cd efflux system component